MGREWVKIAEVMLGIVGAKGLRQGLRGWGRVKLPINQSIRQSFHLQVTKPSREADLLAVAGVHRAQQEDQ